MTRRLAVALVVMGLGLVLVGLRAYGEQIVGSWCLNGEPSDSVGRGTCSYNEGVDVERGPRTVDTLIGQPASWAGWTQWPTLVAGSAAAVAGLVALGATSGLALGSNRRKHSASAPASASTTLVPGASGRRVPDAPPTDLAGAIFELRVEVAAHTEGYSVEITTPSGASGRTLRNEPLPLDRGVAKLTELAREPNRLRFGSRKSKAVTTFGAELFASIFSAAGERAFCDSTDFVRRHNATLRIVLQVDDEYADIPWEYLFDPHRGAFLARSRETSLVRHHASAQATRFQPDIDCLRVLAMAASPRRTARLDLTTDHRSIAEALGPAIDGGHLELEFVDGGTQVALDRALKSFRPHVFYFAGHGDWNDERDDGVILFEDHAGNPDPVTGVRLGTLLNQPELRLAIVNSCHAATPSKRDRFAGVTSSLLAQGVPAAIGMQFRFEDKAAITFGTTLLAELAAGVPLDRAVTDARIAVYALPSEIEWGTPVLATRVPIDRVIPRSNHATGTTYARS